MKVSQFKRVISLVMGFSLLTSISVSAGAASFSSSEEVQKLIRDDLGVSYVSPKLANTVQKDLNNLSSVGLNNISIGSVNEDGSINYISSNSNGNSDTLTIKENRNGDINLDVTNGDRHDNVVIKEDGTILLDGEEVLIEFIQDASSDTANLPTMDVMPSPDAMRANLPTMNAMTSEVMRIGGSQHIYSENNLATRGYYTNFKSFPTQKITFTKYLGQMTAAGAITIFVASLKQAVKAALAGGYTFAFEQFCSAYYSYICDQLIWKAQEVAPTTKYASIRISSWSNNENNGLLDYYKYYFEYYASDALQEGTKAADQIIYHERSTN